MDDDSNKLLIEIRDILRDASEREAARHKQLLANTKRARIIVFFIILPILFIFLAICAWGIISSSQSERERTQEYRRHNEQLQRNHEELQRKLEERRNQFVRPAGPLG